MVQRQSTEGDVGRRWPTLEKQVAAVHAPPGSPLAKVIADNQDFSILRPEEASDNLRLPRKCCFERLHEQLQPAATRDLRRTPTKDRSRNLPTW
jgi:hypothetical protein